MCGIWGHSPGISDHKPWDRDQHFFFSRDQGLGCTIFMESGTKNFSLFWNQVSEILVQKWDQRREKFSRYDAVISHTFFINFEILNSISGSNYQKRT